jgi:hypothetical protein
MANDLRYSLGLDGSKFDGAVSKSLAGIQGLGGALAALGATGAFLSLLKEGFEFNKMMGDAESGIANVLAKYKGLNAEAAKGEAAKAMDQIRELEPKAAGTMEDLVQGFTATLAASQAAGLSVEQNIDLVGKFANALANTGTPADQLAQEMRSIITANIGADSSLARTLNLTNEMVTTARDAGELYPFLVGIIGQLGEAGDTATVAFTSLLSAIKAAAGALAKGLFDQAVEGSKNLTEAIKENQSSFEAMGQSLATITTGALTLFAGVKSVMEGLGATAAVIDDVFRNGTSWSDAWANAQKVLQAEIDKTAEKAGNANKQLPGPNGPEAAPTGKSGSGGGGKTAQQMQQARELLLMEVAAADAAARGQDKKAAALRRELDIRRDMQRIIEQTGASEEQARKLAERLNPEVSTRADGRRKIKGVQSSQFMGSAGGGGLDQFHKMQEKREVTTAEMEATRKARGGGRGLPVGQSTGFVPAFPAFPQPQKQAAAVLSQPATATAKDSAAGGNALTFLKSIDESLKSLKAA